MLGTLLYQGTWMAEGVVALAILLRDLYRRDWMRVAGLLAGFVVGFWTYLGFYLPVFGRPGFTAYNTFAAPITLTVAYGVRRRWVHFLVALVLGGGPMAYLLLARLMSSQASAAAPELLQFLLEVNFFLAPIIAVLAGRELGAWIGSLVAKEQTA